MDLENRLKLHAETIQRTAMDGNEHAAKLVRYQEIGMTMVCTDIFEEWKKSLSPEDAAHVAATEIMLRVFS